ncbi:hypothetical protein JOF36_005606 [Pseudonocardia parietis]|uniref:Uncharacterized protein n=1 Tax=Pseudonocardia parietis TaxID=570936 RepID=A0ABS4W170_9PSEU|nr:hypothetical protein [Pseudonocardia parietis]
MDMELWIPVAGVVLEELGDDELVGVDPSPTATPVVTSAGIARGVLEVVETCPCTCQNRVLDRLVVGRPSRCRPVVSCGAGVVGCPLEGDAQHRDALRRRECRVDEGDGLPRRCLRLGLQLRAPLRPGVRLGSDQTGVDLVARAVLAMWGGERRRLAPTRP